MDTKYSQTPVSKHVCEKCGNEADTYSIGDTVLYRKFCNKCQLENDFASQNIENSRDEINRRNEISQRIGRVIPRLYLGAEIEKLPEGLQNKICCLTSDHGIYIFGPVGCGKSYSLAAILKSCIQKGLWPVMRINWEQFLGWLRSSFSESPGESDRIIQRAAKAAVLAIDDLGIGDRESDFSLKTIYQIVDFRCENGLPTFYAANRPPEDIGTLFDKRISSRIIGHCDVICLSGMDLRLKK